MQRAGILRAEGVAGRRRNFFFPDSRLFNNAPPMKALHTVSALLEIGAGLALLSFPSATVTLLVGAPLETAAAVSVARVGGAGLLALGVACWFARQDARSCAARGLISAMVLYNVGVAVILGVAGLGAQPAGPALWPAVVLHAGLTAWCLKSLWKKPAQKAPLENNP